MADQATETVTTTFGETAVGYLELAGAKRQELLNSRLSAFASQTDLPPWQAMTHHVRELGGIYANELLMSAPVEVDSDPRPWTNLLASQSSIAVDPEGLSMSFFSQRSFDPDASRILGAPTVAYSEGLMAVAHNSEPRPDASVIVIDREGPREILAVQAEPEPKLPIEVPDRRKRFSAYADHLVGWQDKEKLYLPITGSQPATVKGLPRAEADIMGGVRYETLTLGEPTLTRPLDLEPPNTPKGDPALSMGMMLPQDPLAGGWAGPDENAAPPGEADGPYNTSTALISGTVTITITRVEGSGGEIGYGPAQIAPPGYGSCTHYNSRDDCKSCCVSVSSIAVTSIIGAGIACHVAASILSRATLLVRLLRRPLLLS